MADERIVRAKPLLVARYRAVSPKSGGTAWASVYEHVINATLEVRLYRDPNDSLPMGESDVTRTQSGGDYARIDSGLEGVSIGNGYGAALYFVSAIAAEDLLGLRGVYSIPGLRSNRAARLWSKLMLRGLVIQRSGCDMLVASRVRPLGYVERLT